MHAVEDTASSTRRQVRVGVDIGGTFTDLCAEEHGRIIGVANRSPRRPIRPRRSRPCCARCSSAWMSRWETSRSSSTAPRSSPTRYRAQGLAHRAAGDGRASATRSRSAASIRYDLYDLILELPRPLVPRYLRFDVPERTLADGTWPSSALDDERRRAAGARAGRGRRRGGGDRVPALLRQRRPRAARARGRAARRAGACASRSPPRSCRRSASTSAPRPRSPTSTCRRSSSATCASCERRLARSGSRGSCFVMLSSGGIATLETAARFPVRLLESGPAAGALAAAHYGAASGASRPALLRHGRHDRQVRRDRATASR